MSSKLDKYEFGPTLQKGTFAKIKCATNKETGEKVVIKIVKAEDIEAEAAVGSMVRREVAAMGKLLALMQEEESYQQQVQAKLEKLRIEMKGGDATTTTTTNAEITTTTTTSNNNKSVVVELAPSSSKVESKSSHLSRNANEDKSNKKDTSNNDNDDSDDDDDDGIDILADAYDGLDSDDDENKGYATIDAGQVSVRLIREDHDDDSDDDAIHNKKKSKNKNQQQFVQKFEQSPAAHVIRFIEILESDEAIYLVMEFVDGMDLFERIEKESNSRLDEPTARRYFKQLVRGLKFVHRCGVAHRDIKPENILIVTNTDSVKISDFGCAAQCIKKGQKVMLKTLCGTEHYLAPEVLAGKQYDGFKSDVWSCGVTLYTMLTGCHPFDDDNVTILTQKIMNLEYQIPSYVSKQARDLIEKMLVVDPKKRLTLEQIEMHPWVAAGDISVVSSSSSRSVFSMQDAFFDNDSDSVESNEYDNIIINRSDSDSDDDEEEEDDDDDDNGNNDSDND